MDKIEFPSLSRAYIVANFVATVDGKIAGPGPNYWPIGSRADLQSLLDLRAACDVLVHGRQTAMSLDHVGRLGSKEFERRREPRGQDNPYTYMVLSAHPDELLLAHIAPAGRRVNVVLVTTEAADSFREIPEGIEVWRCGSDVIDLVKWRGELLGHGFRNCALEAGPKLFGAVVAARLVDELWLTVAPKLFGTSFGTPTMINGQLFEAGQVPALEVVSLRQLENEIYVRYRFKQVAE